MSLLSDTKKSYFESYDGTHFSVLTHTYDYFSEGKL
jgi:hypothetical protein